MKTVHVFLILLLLSIGCARNESQFAQIMAIEDSRQPCAQLLSYLSDIEPKIRTRALQAIARLQDSTCVEPAARLLDDVNHNVRSEAAFALGQIGGKVAEQALLARLKRKDIVSVKGRILDALGRISGPAAFPSIIRHLQSLRAEVRGQAALAIGQLAYRGITDSTLTQAAVKLLGDSDADVRWRAAYALMRVGKDFDPIPLVAATDDADSRVRMYALQALGKLNDYRFIDPIGKALSSDRVWRVRVSAANAFGEYPLSLSANYLSLLNQAQPVRVAIIQAIGKGAQHEPGGYRSNSRELNLARHELEQVLAQEHGADYSEGEKSAALLAHARLMGTNAYDELLKYAAGANPRLQAQAMKALGEIGSRRALNIFRHYYTDSTSRVVKIAIIEALPAIGEDEGLPIFVKALNDSDAVLVALGADAVAKDTLKNKIYAKRVIEAYARVAAYIDAESARTIFSAMAKFKDPAALPFLRRALRSEQPAVRSAAEQALRLIGGKIDSTGAPPEPRSLALGQCVDALRIRSAHAIISTERGDIDIELLPQDAPMTVSNFIKLARSGFYDGLLFHRVIPNFIIQNGDPRGDGWGSPGYAIRSEFNKNTFARGAVGMASAGKDTEGSQFFITQSPQPHLDGRYTLFGRVTSGMDAVDAIQQGDVIRKVTIQR